MPNSDDDDVLLHVFVSYNHRDKQWLERLQVHLAPLKQSRIDAWDDTRIKPGSKWREEIQRAVKKADAGILLISADFLASDFIRTNELPPLLEAAKDKGMLILLVIVSPCLFHKEADLAEFQTINDPSSSLICLPVGKQEATFVRVAESLLEKLSLLDSKPQQLTEGSAGPVGENFLEQETWTRLLKIGNWIFDAKQVRITGSGVGAFLLSRGEYGETVFTIKARLQFTNFRPPEGERLGMNAGIVLGWTAEAGSTRYHNILLTGRELLIERIGFRGGRYEHLTEEFPLAIEDDAPLEFQVDVKADKIDIHVNDKRLCSVPRPVGIVGRVGLRAWRSKMDCTKFTVSPITRSN